MAVRKVNFVIIVSMPVKYGNDSVLVVDKEHPALALVPREGVDIALHLDGADMLVEAGFHIVEEKLIFVVRYRQLLTVGANGKIDVFLAALPEGDGVREFGVHVPLFYGLILRRGIEITLARWIPDDICDFFAV